MSNDSTGSDENLGRLDDEQEAQEPASSSDGPPETDFDPAEGSPGTAHPVGEDFPDEGVRYGEDGRPRSESEGS